MIKSKQQILDKLHDMNATGLHNAMILHLNSTMSVFDRTIYSDRYQEVISWINNEYSYYRRNNIPTIVYLNGEQLYTHNSTDLVEVIEKLQSRR